MRTNLSYKIYFLLLISIASFGQEEIIECKNTTGLYLVSGKKKLPIKENYAVSIITQSIDSLGRQVKITYMGLLKDLNDSKLFFQSNSKSKHYYEGNQVVHYEFNQYYDNTPIEIISIDSIEALLLNNYNNSLTNLGAFLASVGGGTLLVGSPIAGFKQSKSYGPIFLVSVAAITTGSILIAKSLKEKQFILNKSLNAENLPLSKKNRKKLKIWSLVKE